MGVVLRQSVKTTFVIFFGALLGAVINFVYIYAMSKTELGLLTNILYQGSIIQFLALLGTGHLIATYIQKYDVDDEKRKVLIGFSCVVTIIANVLFTTLYFSLKSFVLSRYQVQDREYLNKFYHLLPVLSVVWSLMSVFEFYLYSQSKAAITTFMKEILLRAFNLLLIGAFFYKILSFSGFMVSSVLVYTVPTILLVYFARKTQGFGISFNYKVFSKEEYKELIHFSWYHLLLGFAMNVLGAIDLLMVGALDKTGMESIAIYRNAVFLVSIMIIPYKAITLASFPTLNQTYIENDTQKMHSLFHRSAVNILIVAIGMFLLIALNLDNFIAFINQLKSGYDDVKPIVLILMIGQLVNMGTGLNNEMLSISKYYRYGFYTAIILLALTVILNRIFIPQYGIYGAAWSSTAALAIFNIIKSVVVWRKLKMSPLSSNTYKVLIAGAIAGCAGYVLPFCVNLYADTILRSVIIIVAYTIALLLLRASDDVNNYINALLKTRKLY